MKKVMLFLILSLLASAVFAQTLDTTIGLAATGVSGSLPRGSTVVMIEFETDSEELANHVIDEMNHNLVTLGLVRPVERRRLNTIRSELTLSTQGEIGDDFAQRIGHMLGAQHIILGSISSVGNQYTIRFRAIATETATIVWSFSQNIRGDTVLESFLSRSGSGTTAQAAPAPSQAAPAPAPAAVVPDVYRIGDTGPAGGIVFYDKGNNSGGWRYLEAAPSDLGRGAWGQNTSATSSDIGSGRQNTQLLRGAAATLCLQYELGGYRDWFLPSKDELDLMYMNLKIRGLGNFSDDWYWSSTNSGTSRAWAQRFSDGVSNNELRSRTYSVRPIRQF